MRWRVAEAKQNFAEVLRAAANEPQLIFNRDRLVALVVDPDSFQAFAAWRDRENRASLADTFAELRRICTEEQYVLEVPVRSDRQNAFVETADDGSL